MVGPLNNIITFSSFINKIANSIDSEPSVLFEQFEVGGGPAVFRGIIMEVVFFLSNPPDYFFYPGGRVSKWVGGEG